MHNRTIKEIVENHKRLIAIMEALPEEKHRQSIWGRYLDNDPRPEACGTSACALGWAALSGEIPGLSCKPNEKFHECMKFHEFKPVLDGHEADLSGWRFVGERCFGPVTQERVFDIAWLTKDQVIDKLKIRLREIEKYGLI